MKCPILHSHGHDKLCYCNQMPYMLYNALQIKPCRG